jgi:hypothetical protein
MRSEDEDVNLPESGGGSPRGRVGGLSKRYSGLLEEYNRPEKLHSVPQERCWQQMYGAYSKNMKKASLALYL